MPYIPKGQHGHAQWIGLVELVELVQAESECSVEEARDQIRDALTDGAIWPLRWEPEPPPTEYCRSIYGAQALAHGKPIYPPPPSPQTRLHDFKDSRDVSHWQDVPINWEQGLVLDDFERQLYQKLGGNLSSIMGWSPEGYPKPRSPEWRTLWLDREACEQLWWLASDGDSSNIPPMSEAALRQWVGDYIKAHQAGGTSSSKHKIWKDFNNDPTVSGRASRDRVWAMYAPPPEWQKKGRRPG